MNLEWIPSNIINFELSQEKLSFANILTNIETKFIITINFVSGKLLKVYINKYEYFLSLKKWLLNLINLNNSNKYEINLLYNNEILNDYLGLLKLNIIFNDSFSITCIINIKIINYVDTTCTSCCAYLYSEEPYGDSYIPSVKVDPIKESINEDRNKIVDSLVEIKEEEKDQIVESSQYTYPNLEVSYEPTKYTIKDFYTKYTIDDLYTYYGDGLLILKDVDPFNITLIPEKYKSIISDIEWDTYKNKLKKRINNFIEYLNFSDDEIDLLKKECLIYFTQSDISNDYSKFETSGKYQTYIINHDLMFDNISLDNDIEEKIKHKL